MRAPLVLITLAACSAAAPAKTAVAPKQWDAFYDAYMAFHPTVAVRLGLHDRDGQLGDRSAAGLAAEVARLHKALDELGRIEAGGVERAVLINVARRELFDLEVRRSPWRNPLLLPLGAERAGLRRARLRAGRRPREGGGGLRPRGPRLPRGGAHEPGRAHPEALDRG